MKIRNVLTVNIDNVDLTDQGKQVYRAILKNKPATAAELCQHLDMSEQAIYLMLAHLYRHDLIRLVA